MFPSLSCSLPQCNETRDQGKLRILTNRAVREWMGYLHFEIAALGLPARAR